MGNFLRQLFKRLTTSKSKPNPFLRPPQLTYLEERITPATITVSSNADAGAGTLRQAIIDANASAGDDTINFGITGTITLASSLPAIVTATTAGTLSVTGPGSTLLTISGNNKNIQVFNISSGANLSFSGITISGANTSFRGTIENSGTLSISDSTLSGNASTSRGGAIFNANGASLSIANSILSGNSSDRGGAICAYGTVTISNSILSGNTGGGNGVDNGGGAIYFRGTVYTSQILTISNTTISGNKASIGGGINSLGKVVMSNSTISGNSATAGPGGGIRNNFDLTLSFCTISGNSAATEGGGVFNARITAATNCTIAGNSAASGGGFYNSSTETNVTLINTILGDNNGGDYGFRVGGGGPGTNGASTNNLVTQGSFAWATTVTSAQLNLGVLQNNGGPTATQALVTGSAAISSTVLGTPNFDQRGFTRTTADIGAYSYNYTGADGIVVSQTLDKQVVLTLPATSSLSDLQLAYNSGANTLTITTVASGFSGSTTFVPSGGIAGITTGTSGSNNTVTIDLATQTLFGGISVVSNSGIGATTLSTALDLSGITGGAANQSITLSTIGGASSTSTIAFSNAIKAKGSGSITLSAGSISGSGVLATSSLSANSATGMTLATQATSFGSIRNLASGTVTISQTGAAVLNSAIINGNLSLTASGAISQAGGAVIVTGTTVLDAGGAAITLDSSSNDFGGGVTVNSSSTSVSLRDANALTISALSLAANATLTAVAGTILSMPAANISTGTGNINLQSLGSALSTTGTLTTTSGTISLFAGGSLTIGHGITTSSGAITLGANGALTIGQGVTTSSGSITFNGSSSGLILSTGVTVDAGSGTIIVDGNDGPITLTGALTTTSNSATAVIIKDATTVSLGAITTGSTGTVQLGYGSISDKTNADIISGVVTQTGVMTTGTLSGCVAAGATLNAQNLITKIASLTSCTGTSGSTGSFTINDIGGITINSFTNYGGSSSFTTSGLLTFFTIDNSYQDLTLNGVGVSNPNNLGIYAKNITVNGGAGAISLGTNIRQTNNGVLTLNNTGSFDVTAGRVNNGFADDGWLRIGASSIGGNLTLSGYGVVQSGGLLTVGGNSTFTATQSGYDVDLGSFANNLAGTVTVNSPSNIRDFKLYNTNSNAGAIVNLTNTAATQLRDLTINYTNAAYELPTLRPSTLRNVSVTAGGAITQASGGVTPTGTSSFNAGSFAITLNDAANDFGGAVTLSNTGANNIAVKDVDDLILAASSVGSGTLTLNAVGITQNGAVTQASSAGAATFNAGAGVITLGNASNDFTGDVSLNNSGANNVAITDSNAIKFAASSLGTGTLTVTSVGITQSGTITQASGAGAATFNAGAGVITLTQSNDFTGNVTLNSTSASVAITDANALTLASPTLGANTGITAIAGTTLSFSAFNLSTGAGNIDFQSLSGTLATNGTLTTSSGTVSLKGSAGVTIGNTITTTSGTVSVLSAAGSINGAGLITTPTITLAASTGIGNTTALNLATALISADSTEGKIDLNNAISSAVTVTSLTSAGKTDPSGALITFDQSGGGTVTFNNVSSALSDPGSGWGAITLTNAGGGITIGGTGVSSAGTTSTISISTTGSGTIAVNAPVDAALNDGNVNLNSAGSISGSGLITGAQASLVANTGINANMNFSLGFSEITSPAGDIIVANVYGIAVPNAIIAAGNVTLTSGQQIILSNPITATGKIVTLTANGGDLDGTSLITANTVALNATAGIGSTGAINLAAFFVSADTTTGAIDINNTSGTAVSVTSLTTSGSAAITFDQTGAGGIGVDGPVTTGTGAITITSQQGILGSGIITQTAGAGAVTFNAGAGVITLTNASNNFTGSVSLNNSGANNVAITDANTIDFGASTLGSGTFTVTAVGITQSGAITQASGAGSATFNAGTGVITLANVGNDFTGAVTLNSTGATVSITDTNALTLASPTLGANTGITAIAGTTLTLPAFNFTTGTGNIDFQFQSGTLAINGTLTTSSGTVSLKGSAGVTVGHNITTTSGSVSVIGAGINLTTGNTIDAGNSTITIDGNDGAITLTGALTTTNTTSAAIIIKDASTVSLGNITTGSTGFVTLGGATIDNLTGAVTQTGVINTGTLTGNTAGDVTLLGGNTIANLGTFASTGSGGFSLNDAGGLTVTGNVSNTSGAVSITTTVSVLSIGADITATGQSLTLTGVGINQTTGTILSAGLTVDAGAGAIALSQTSNDFTGAVSLNNSGANNVAITDVNAIDFGTSTLGSGTFTVTAVGITQSGAITAAGTSSFNAGAGVITLTQFNDFTGAVSLNNSGTNNVAITDANAIDFGASTLGTGTFAVTAVGITQSGAITQASSAGTVTFNAGLGVITLSDVSNDFTGSVSLNNSGANNVSITDTNAIDFGASTLGSGSFTVTAVGITQSGAITAAGTSSFNAGAGVITLANAGNNFTGAVSLNNSGVNNVAITDVNAIDFGTSTLGSGSFTVTAVGITQIGAITQASSASTVTFNAGAGVITLTQSNDFTGSVSLNNSGVNNVAITDANAIDFDASTLGSGSFTVTAVGITQSGAITQASSAGAATFNAGTGVVTLTQSNDFTGSVSLNNSGTNNVAITDLNAIDFGTSTLGSGSFTVTAVGITQSGAITVAGTSLFNAGAGVITLTQSNDFTGSVTLNSTGATVAITDINAIDFASSTLGSGSFTATAVGITQTGAITVAGTSSFNAGAGVITLSNAGNNFTGSVALNSTGATVAITDVNAIDFGSSILGSGTFTVTAVGITQTGAITAAGASSFNALAGVITLANASNNFTGSVSLNNSGANNVAITDVNAIDFGTSALGSGSFTVTAVGITQSGAITQASSAGTVTFNASLGVITLANASNDFTGTVTLNSTGATVAITDMNAIDFANSTLGSGSFTVIAVGITQSGAITQASSAGAVTFNAGSGVITLTQSNDFTGSVTLNSTGATVAITDINAIDFANSTLGSGSFTVTAVGITQSGAITQASSAGTVTFNAGAGVITLANASNDFTASVALNSTGATVAIRDLNAIDFGASTLGSGTFTVTAVGITQSGTITQASSAGSATFNAGTGVITLSNAGNNFTGSVALNSTGATVAITDTNAIDFGASTLGSGSFTVTAVGITQSGAITQASSAGTVTFNAGAGVITLANASNDFTGSVTLNSTGATVAITDMNAIDFANSTLGSGSFTVTAVGITQSGAITQASSAGAVTFNAGAGVITLTNASNDFTGSVSLNNSGNNNVSVQDNTDLPMGLSNVGSGTLSLNAGSSGSIQLSSNVSSFNGVQNYNSPIVLTANVDINAGTANINLPDSISGSFSLTPITSAPGVTTISGANTNTTTNVTTGVVQINNSTPQTTNFVVSGGTLKGTGAIGNLTATGTGIIAPGNSPGQVTTTNLSLSSTNTLQIEITGASATPVAGTDYDQIVVSSGGTVTLGGATLTLSTTYTGNAGTVFTIIDNQGSISISGTFNGLSEGSVVSANGRAYQISYVGGTGNDVTLSVLNAPTVTLFNPTSGKIGTSVVITGSDFINVSQVSFNGTAQTTYTLDSPTQITTTVPSGATTGTISVTTGAGTGTSTNSFTVDSTAPTLSISASPGSLKANETSTITFTFSEVVTGFSSSIITVTNGTITSPVASNSTVYTSVFTPTLGIKADGTIAVSNNYFDLLGNQGTASTLTPPIAINTVQTPLVTGSASTSQSGASVVSLINPDTGETIGSAVPFPDFTGEIRVVSGDFNGDGKVDILAAAGPGGGPAVAILDSETGEVMESFFAFDPAFTGGVFIAVRDFNGDGLLDIIAGAGAGGGPEVRIFSGNGLTVIRSFFAYAEDFTGGVSVASVDFNSDGILDLVTGAGPSGAPHVKVFDGASGNIISQWYAYPISFTGGVFVAAGDIGNDGNIEVVTGAGTGGAPVVAVWDPYTGALLSQFMAYAEDFTGGVRVGVSDGNFDGILDLVTGAGPGGGPEVKGFSFPTLDLLFSFFSGDPSNTSGVFVS